jgi:hypothetical protein
MTNDTLILREAELNFIGWSGSNAQMHELRAPCGCRFSDDGQALHGVCTAHMSDPTIRNIRLDPSAVSAAKAAA